MDNIFGSDITYITSLGSLTMAMLYPARSRWGTYRGCFSRRDGARTS